MFIFCDIYLVIILSELFLIMRFYIFKKNMFSYIYIYGCIYIYVLIERRKKKRVEKEERDRGRKGEKEKEMNCRFYLLFYISI